MKFFENKYLNKKYKYVFGGYLGTSDSIILFANGKKESMFSNKYEISLFGLNRITGKKVFESDLKTSSSKIFPSSVMNLSSSEIIIIGEEFGVNDNLIKDASKGLTTWTFDKNGNLLKQQPISWEKDFSKYFKINNKGSIDKIGNLFFHKFIKTDNGKIFAIAEGYKTEASVSGIILGSFVDYVTTDLVLLELNKDMKLQDCKVFEKKSNTANISSGIVMSSKYLVAKAIKAKGLFDYLFVQKGENNNFTIGYIDNERGKNSGLYFNAINVNESGIQKDKILINKKQSTSMVHSAKPGYILLYNESMQNIVFEKRVTNIKQKYDFQNK